MTASLEGTDWLDRAAALPCAASRAAALARQEQLTKPPGALGRLEDLAVSLAALQGRERPRADGVWISVFAADHGIAGRGVSAYPQSVTAAMLANFAAGGAAIAVLARTLNARLEVVNLGTVGDAGPHPGVRHQPLGPGTADFSTGPAMTVAQCAAALATGRDSLLRARAAGADIFIGGEMGIGNSTSAAALGCALLDAPPETLAGPGTGLDAAGVARKAALIGEALGLHRPHCHSPLETLRRLGGFEIAALTGAFVAAAQHGLPVLVDGFIASSAALLACRLRPDAHPWLLFGHASAEPGHALLLSALAARPLLQLDMRLGEGSGAASAVPLLRLACALHGGMATFAEAGIDGA